MDITVNGKQCRLTVQMTMSDFVKSHNLNPATIIIEYNGEIAAREKWESLALQEDDNVEIITFVGGG